MREESDMKRTLIEQFENGDTVEHTRDVDWVEVRAARDADLASCDWRALKDVVLSTPWRDFRQALRDLPQDHAEANDAADSWPTPPE
jgi:hypothetical protein